MRERKLIIIKGEKEMNKGIAGEARAIKYLENKGGEVQDVSNQPEYGKKDIDLIAKKDERVRTIEVKGDAQMNGTGNMFLETCTDICANAQGGFNYTEAEFLFYGDAIAKSFHICLMQELREYVKLFHNDIREVKATDGDGSTSTGLIVSVEKFERWREENDIRKKTI